ncbi:MULTISPECIES: AraC family transcriptional regulator [Flavobacteriaceae]|uniref:AraC family transcriptional regulator n=1 Tax=Flavobacteriaceae TaxID=49546 RepID=UPI001491A526|nr:MULTISPECIES: AraC family transcriptional regulator [Allomuricauda]MDC6366980.1 AraC family transcriptional regulator ligand-binding domain-containing protein [Muricauda sp. AC10]
MYFSSTIISDFMAFAAIQGADIDALRKTFPIDTGQKHVSYDTVVAMLNYLGQELDDNYIGLHVGEQMSLKVTAYVDSIMQHSKTLEDAFDNAVYYSRLISDALECNLVKNEGSYVVVFEENPNWQVYPVWAKRQILDLTLLCCLKSLVAYTGKTYFPSKVNFHTTRPKSMNEYYRLFNCSLKFNQPKTEICFERQIFDRYSKQIEFGLLESLKEKVNEEIQNLKTENEVVYQLKKAILNGKPDRISLWHASSAMGMSKRTLQRKLKDLNTNFKEVEHELQLKLSKTYLHEQRKSIDEISFLLGFSESSAFIRFFKTHTKMTPTAYVNKRVLENPSVSNARG